MLCSCKQNRKRKERTFWETDRSFKVRVQSKVLKYHQPINGILSLALRLKKRLARSCTLDINIVYFIINLKTNGIKTSNITDQIDRIRISIMHCKTIQPSKMLTDTINILKVETEKEYVEDSNLLIESLKNELISAIKGEKGDSWLSNLNTYVSKDFCWNSKGAIESLLKSKISEKLNVNKTLFIESDIYKKWYSQESNWLIAEAAFGSYWNEIENIKNSWNISNTSINKINSRRQSAIKIVNSQNFTKKRNSKFCIKIIDMISEEMMKASINHNSEKVVGWQKLWTLSENDIQEKPFEAIKLLSSTRGRLIVSQNWRKIARHPSFLQQTLLQESYGLKFNKSRTELSKY